MLWLIRQYPKVGVAFLVLGAQLLFYYVLGLSGLRRLPKEASVFFVFLSMYFVLISGSSYAVGRYRMPIMPLICIAAGAAIVHYSGQSFERPPRNDEAGVTRSPSAVTN